MKYTALLSTTILPKDGLYEILTLEYIPEIKDVPHYIGHPSTKEIVEELGAIPAPTKMFTGLDIQERVIACSIKPGRSSRPLEGKTVDQDVTLEDLQFRLIIRLA